jgi:polysaccharide export outer membrane protein
MVLILKISLAGLVVLALASPCLSAEPEIFRTIPTPNGCAVVFDHAAADYRLDRLVDGGIVLALNKVRIPAQEREIPGGCPGRIRVSSAFDGQGATIELRPASYEFSSLIRSGESLKLSFEKLTELSGAPASGPDESYRIGVGDQVAITVFGNDDLANKKFVVGADGTIDYPLLGNVQIAGKSPREVQGFLTAALGKEFLVNPQVSVEMVTYKSQFVFVTGAVKTPGKVALQGGTTLKDALSEVGGLTADAGYSIQVARATLGADGIPREPEKRVFSRKDIETGLANLVLKPSDVVTVSEKDFFYIQGEVRKPGKYELKPGLTLMQAIAIAEGLTDWADRGEVRVFRSGGDQGKLKVSLKNIEKEKTPDVPLSPGDNIIVSRRIL